MDLGNPIETIVRYLLIERMTYLNHQSEFFMMSALVCTVTHWTGPTVNRDVRLSIVIIHQAIILYELSTLRGY